MPKIYSQSDLLKELSAMVAESSQTATALHLGITVQMVNDLLRGRRDFSDRIATAMGYQREIIFRKKAA